VSAAGPAGPPEVLRTARLELTRARTNDLDEVVEAVDASLAELAPWMPWAQDPDATREGTAAFLEEADDRWASGAEWSYVVRLVSGSGAAGVVGIIDRVGPDAREIGYWVRTALSGRGVATEAAGALTGAGLALPGVARMEIHCDEANVRSARVAARLGYRLVETRAYEGDAPGDTGRLQIWETTGDASGAQPS
jgi:RimJ/RimL family protein N-acetyltransferase